MFSVIIITPDCSIRVSQSSYKFGFYFLTTTNANHSTTKLQAQLATTITTRFFIFLKGGKRHVSPNPTTCYTRNHMRNNAIFRYRSLTSQCHQFRFRTQISWKVVRFDQDVELIWIGKLIAEISFGAAGQTICRVWSDYLRRGSWSSVTDPIKHLHIPVLVSLM